MNKLTYAVLSALAVAGLSACSDSDSGAVPTDSTSAGGTVVGTVAGFSSVILDNGVAYDTDNVTECDPDDVGIAGNCEDSVAVGMNISMKLDDSGALVAGLLELEEIASDCESYELEGPLDEMTTNAITVLGITYGLDGNTSMPVSMPASGDIVEIVDTNADGIADSVDADETESIDEAEDSTSTDEPI